MIRPNVLSKPIGMLCMPLQPIGSDSSLQNAADVFRDTGSPVLAVRDGVDIKGVIDEYDLAQALASGLDPTASVENIPYSQVPILLATATGAEALRVFMDKSVQALVVVDPSMNVVGVLTPARLYPHDFSPMRPKMVGGMATPRGVFLTTGAQTGGVHPWSLILTGMLLFTLITLSSILSGYAGEWLVRQRAESHIIQLGVPVLSTLMFLFGLRSTPLAGYHAAEHMVVHAIERGEDLNYEIVKRMPRVHPRCGTNLAVAATLFLSILTTPLIASDDVRLLLAIIVTMALWRPLGSAMQYYATTRPPNRQQVEAGIKAGQMLLDTYAKSPIISPTPLMRIFNSGMIQVVVGSVTMSLILYGIGMLFHIPQLMVLQ